MDLPEKWIWQKNGFTRKMDSPEKMDLEPGLLQPQPPLFIVLLDFLLEDFFDIVIKGIYYNVIIIQCQRGSRNDDDSKHCRVAESREPRLPPTFPYCPSLGRQRVRCFDLCPISSF